MVLGRYEAAAIRINQWINVSFAGLVASIEEKESQLE